MPKDTGSSPPPSPPPSLSFPELAKNAQAVNALTDDLRASIDSVDASLRPLNLGVTTWVDVRVERTRVAEDFELFDSVELGYAKVDGRWGVAIRNTHGPSDDPDNIEVKTWLFNDGPRAMRIEAIDGLPSLFEQLSKDVKALGTRIFEKVKAANAFAKDVVTSATALGLVEKTSPNRKDGQR